MQDELIRKHHGKVAVFYKGKLVTVQEDLQKAIKYAKRKTHGRDFFVMELYKPEEQAAAILWLDVIFRVNTCRNHPFMVGKPVTDEYFAGHGRGGQKVGRGGQATSSGEANSLETEKRGNSEVRLS